MTATAPHVRVEVRELGYARGVCAYCRVDWPCPDYAQARERAVEREVAELPHGRPSSFMPCVCCVIVDGERVPILDPGRDVEPDTSDT